MREGERCALWIDYNRALNYNGNFVFMFCCAFFVPIPDFKFFILGSDLALGSSPSPGLRIGFSVPCLGSFSC
jgi:hypothetical protein